MNKRNNNNNQRRNFTNSHRRVRSLNTMASYNNQRIGTNPRDSYNNKNYYNNYKTNHGRDTTFNVRQKNHDTRRFVTKDKENDDSSYYVDDEFHNNRHYDEEERPALRYDSSDNDESRTRRDYYSRGRSPRHDHDSNNNDAYFGRHESREFFAENFPSKQRSGYRRDDYSTSTRRSSNDYYANNVSSADESRNGNRYSSEIGTSMDYDHKPVRQRETRDDYSFIFPKDAPVVEKYYREESSRGRSGDRGKDFNEERYRTRTHESAERSSYKRHSETDDYPRDSTRNEEGQPPRVHASLEEYYRKQMMNESAEDRKDDKSEMGRKVLESYGISISDVADYLTKEIERREKSGSLTTNPLSQLLGDRLSQNDIRNTDLSTHSRDFNDMPLVEGTSVVRENIPHSRTESQRPKKRSISPIVYDIDDGTPSPTEQRSQSSLSGVTQDARIDIESRRSRRSTRSPVLYELPELSRIDTSSSQYEKEMYSQRSQEHRSVSPRDRVSSYQRDRIRSVSPHERDNYRQSDRKRSISPQHRNTLPRNDRKRSPSPLQRDNPYKWESKRSNFPVGQMESPNERKRSASPQNRNESLYNERRRSYSPRGRNQSRCNERERSLSPREQDYRHNNRRRSISPRSREISQRSERSKRSVSPYLDEQASYRMERRRSTSPLDRARLASLHKRNESNSSPLSSQVEPKESIEDMLIKAADHSLKQYKDHQVTQFIANKFMVQTPRSSILPVQSAYPFLQQQQTMVLAQTQTIRSLPVHMAPGIFPSPGLLRTPGILPSRGILPTLGEIPAQPTRNHQPKPNIETPKQASFETQTDESNIAEQLSLLRRSSTQKPSTSEEVCFEDRKGDGIEIEVKQENMEIASASTSEDEVEITHIVNPKKRKSNCNILKSIIQTVARPPPLMHSLHRKVAAPEQSNDKNTIKSEEITSTSSSSNVTKTLNTSSSSGSKPKTKVRVPSWFTSRCIELFKKRHKKIQQLKHAKQDPNLSSSKVEMIKASLRDIDREYIPLCKKTKSDYFAQSENSGKKDNIAAIVGLDDSKSSDIGDV